MEITLIILSIVFSVISGFAKAIMDLSEEGKLKFKKKSFWIKELSYINKWKNGDKKQGEKFFGSSRWFVSLTDAWHLFGLIFRLSFATSFLLVGYLIALNNWHYFLLLNYPLFALVFHIFHTYKILKK